MAVYNYKGINSKGKKTSGFIETDGKSSAVSLLKSKEIYVTEILEDSSVLKPARDKKDLSVPVHGGSMADAKEITFSGERLDRLFANIKNILNKKVEKKPSQTEILVFIRQLSSMIKAGIPLYDSLEDIKNQIKNKMFKRAVSGIGSSIKEGSTFSSALRKYPQIFPNIIISSAEAGEESGSLSGVLEKLSFYLEEKNVLSKKISSALIYPLIMSLVGSGILFYIIVYIVPVISRVFKSMHHALPLPTRIVLFVSYSVSHYIILIAVVAVAAYLYLARYFKTEKGKIRLDSFLLKLPVLGKLLILRDTDLFAQSMATLLYSGVIITKALDVASSNINNIIIKNALIKAKQGLVEGKSLSGPMAESGLFPTILVNMVRTGEKSGNLEEMLMVTSSVIKNELDFYISSMTQLLEPAMVIIMGFVVGFIVISIMLPIFEMSSLVQR